MRDKGKFIDSAADPGRRSSCQPRVAVGNPPPVGAESAGRAGRRRLSQQARTPCAQPHAGAAATEALARECRVSSMFSTQQV